MENTPPPHFENASFRNHSCVSDGREGPTTSSLGMDNILAYIAPGDTQFSGAGDDTLVPRQPRTFLVWSMVPLASK